MPFLQRHGLVRLNPEGWVQVLAHDWDAEARACIGHWAAHDLPLVVTRQPVRGPDLAPLGDALPDGGPEDEVPPSRALALGLPAPACWSRRRLALGVPAAAVLPTDPFPRMAAITPLLPRAAQGTWAALRRACDGAGLAVRVYGSHGWQRLTGLAYLHADSDLDLLIPVDDPTAADRAARLLAAAPLATPRLDGELLFPDGAAVAWREWAAWRTGEAAAVLVKRRDGVALARSLADIGTWPAAAEPELAA